MTNESNKLIYTALGAAAAGAALAIGIMKLTEGGKKGGIDPSKGRGYAPPLVFMNDASESGDVDFSRRGSEASLLFPHNHEEKMRRRVATRYSIEEENNTPRDSVTVRVPATSANVGPGCKFISTRCSIDDLSIHDRNMLTNLSCLWGIRR